jgi:hypothetical protein
MAYATANAVALGINILSAEWTNLVAAKTDWDAKYPAHIAGQNTASSLREAKDVSRGNGDGLLSALIAILRANKAQVSNAELEALGLSVYDTIRTAAPVPTSRPVGRVDTSQRLQQTISWSDESTPTSIRKPAGVQGAMLYLKIGGAAPTSIAECEFVAFDTKTPYVYDFDPSAGGQTAYWLLLWANTRGETGPISETVAATVVA